MESMKQLINANTVLGSDNSGDLYAPYFSKYFSEIQKILADPAKYAPVDDSERINLIEAQNNEYNKSKGALTGYDCKICKNKGDIYLMQDGKRVVRQCKCKAVRDSFNRIEKSGMKNTLHNYTFERFETKTPMQATMLKKAKSFLMGGGADGWFFAGGQVGAGKTHICTAIAGEFLRQGKAARYMAWQDESVRLKAKVNDDIEYQNAVSPLKTVMVLYIDDLFKTKKDTLPTPADVKLAFEILNYRYINRELITIISSEHEIEPLLDIDEAIGSRIYEMSKNFCITIAPDKSKNYRMQ